MKRQYILLKPDFDAAVTMCLTEITEFERQWVSITFSSLNVVNPSSAELKPRYIYTFDVLELELK